MSTCRSSNLLSHIFVSEELVSHEGYLSLVRDLTHFETDSVRRIEDMKLSNNLKTLMTKEKINLVELAQAAKVPKQTLHNWLSGAEPKSLDQVRAVANVFGLSIEELCYGEKTKSRDSIEEYTQEINAGVFEVVLRRIKKQ